jgi:hypothetical protein
MARAKTTASDIARLRLQNQRLIGAGFDRAEQVVGWLGAVQSQDYAGAKWGVAQRVSDASDAAIEAAFTRGAILRTHVLRPTWHFVLPSDIRWLLALTAPRVRPTFAPYDKKLEIDAKVRVAANAVFERALAGTALTREVLGQKLMAAGIPARGQRLAHLLAHAELDALICSGPRQGKQFTYALLDERAPQSGREARPRDEALAELTRRYFQSHGPALVHDFAWWASLTVGDARRGIESIGLEQITLEDKAYWFLPPSATSVRTRGPLVHLLPNYDEHVGSYKDYFVSFDRARFSGPFGSMLNNHIAVLNGQVIGGWRRTLAKGHVAIDVNLLAKLEPRERDLLEREAERYGAYLALPARLQAKVAKAKGSVKAGRAERAG